MDDQAAQPPRKRRKRPAGAKTGSLPLPPPKPPLSARLGAFAVSMVKDVIFLGVIAGLAVWGLSHTTWGAEKLGQAKQALFERASGVPSTGGRATGGRPEADGLFIPVEPRVDREVKWGNFEALGGQTFTLAEGVKVWINQVECPWKIFAKSEAPTRQGIMAGTVEAPTRDAAGDDLLRRLEFHMVKAGGRDAPASPIYKAYLLPKGAPPGTPPKPNQAADGAVPPGMVAVQGYYGFVLIWEAAPSDRFTGLRIKLKPGTGS